MKFFAPLFALVTAVCAQTVSVSVPTDGATLTAGQQTTVEVDRPVCAHTLLQVNIY
jgi:hypothetical protein